MSYQLLCDQYVFDTNSLKFVSLRDFIPDVIETSTGMRSLLGYPSSIKYSESLIWNRTVRLNDLTIYFSNFELRSGTPVYAWHQATMMFHNPKTNKPEKLVLSADPSFLYRSYLGDAKELGKVSYEFNVGDKDFYYITEFSKTPQNKVYFRFIDGLGKMRDSSQTTPDIFSFGLSPLLHKVKYAGNLLNGSSYMFVCGTWGILLDDEFRFDSLAILSRIHVRPTMIVTTVDKFLYTVNPYIMKLMFMKK